MKFRDLVDAEKAKARERYPILFNSLHEGYAVLLEEVDEFWDQVKRKSELRDKQNVLEELVQISATVELISEEFELTDEIDKPNIDRERYIQLLTSLLSDSGLAYVLNPQTKAEEWRIVFDRIKKEVYEECISTLR